MIELKSVTKEYGTTTAIHRMTLQIQKPGLYCLLGKNGAGKTTLMKLLAGQIAATSGTVAVDGKTVSPSRMPESVHYIESNAAQFNMKVSALIDSAAGLQKDFNRDFALQMAERFELNPNKRFKQLSFGMKTMLTTIMTLANNTNVVLLDEPTLGFDAIMRQQFNTLLLESYEARPRIIIVSTHLIDEIAKVVQRLIIINNGRLLLEAGIEDIDERAYTLSGSVKAITPLLSTLRCIGQTTAGSVMAAHIYDDRITPPEGVALDRMGLQDFFIHIVGGAAHE